MRDVRRTQCTATGGQVSIILLLPLLDRPHSFFDAGGAAYDIVYTLYRVKARPRFTITLYCYCLRKITDFNWRNEHIKVISIYYTAAYICWIYISFTFFFIFLEGTGQETRLNLKYLNRFFLFLIIREQCGQYEY